VTVSDCSESFKIELANDLADIAGHHGIRMFSCCGDYLMRDGKVEKAHCIDGDIIESLFNPNGLRHREKPTRQECGCTGSSDIGAYDTCPHGCVYCYANMHKRKARKTFDNHDEDSAFLGHSKSKSDKWLEEMRPLGTDRGSSFDDSKSLWS
jgi:hypothetical protein